MTNSILSFPEVKLPFFYQVEKILIVMFLLSFCDKQLFGMKIEKKSWIYIIANRQKSCHKSQQNFA